MRLQLDGSTTKTLWVAHGRERSRPPASRAGSRRADRSRPCALNVSGTDICLICEGYSRDQLRITGGYVEHLRTIHERFISHHRRETP